MQNIVSCVALISAARLQGNKTTTYGDSVAPWSEIKMNWNFLLRTSGPFGRDCPGEGSLKASYQGNAELALSSDCV
jgi:hypothetical protein